MRTDDKTVGGRTREEEEEEKLGGRILDALAARGRAEYSRGIREGLERAAKTAESLNFSTLGQLVVAIRAEASKLDGEGPKRGRYLVVHKPDDECDMLGVHRVNACLKPNPPGPSARRFAEERGCGIFPGERPECGVRFGYNNGSANHNGDGPNVFDRCRLKPSHTGPHGYPAGYKRPAEERELEAARWAAKQHAARAAEIARVAERSQWPPYDELEPFR